MDIYDKHNISVINKRVYIHRGESDHFTCRLTDTTTSNVTLEWRNVTNSRMIKSGNSNSLRLDIQSAAADNVTYKCIYEESNHIYQHSFILSLACK